MALDLAAVLPRSDLRLVEDMAIEAGVSVEVLAAQMVREYLNLARSAPEVLPANPMRRLAARNGAGRA